jgi:hypothetical protein
MKHAGTLLLPCDAMVKMKALEEAGAVVVLYWALWAIQDEASLEKVVQYARFSR